MTAHTGGPTVAQHIAHVAELHNNKAAYAEKYGMSDVHPRILRECGTLIAAAPATAALLERVLDALAEGAVFDPSDEKQDQAFNIWQSEADALLKEAGRV